MRLRRVRPEPLADQRLDMALIVEARHVVVGLRLEHRRRDAAARIGPEKRQAAAMQEIVDEGGDEDGLAGARRGR